MHHISSSSGDCAKQCRKLFGIVGDVKEVGGDGISLSLDGGSAIASGVSGTTELEGGGRPGRWLPQDSREACAYLLQLFASALLHFSSSLQLFICISSFARLFATCVISSFGSLSHLRRRRLYNSALPPPLPYFLPTTNHLPPSTDHGFSQHYTPTTSTYHLLPTHSHTHGPSCQTSHVSTGPNSKAPATCSSSAKLSTTWTRFKTSAAS